MEKAAAGALQLKPVVARLPYRILNSLQASVPFFAIPRRPELRCGPAAPSPGHPSAGLMVKEILTHQRLGGRVVQRTLNWELRFLC